MCYRNITVEGIRLLNAKTIHFDSLNYGYLYEGITNNDLRYFTNLSTITLPYRFILNNRGSRYLCNVKHIHLPYNDSGKPDLPLRYLTNAKNIYFISSNWNIQQLMSLSMFGTKTIHIRRNILYEIEYLKRIGIKIKHY